MLGKTFYKQEQFDNQAVTYEYDRIYISLGYFNLDYCTEQIILHKMLKTI